MSEERVHPDVAIARIAANQHGVVTLEQLRAAGLSSQAITYRLRAGRLHRIHRGVYAVGHTRLSFEGKCMAAALACGSGAAISHRAAAALWRVLPSPSGLLDVTVPRRGGRRKRKGIRLHRSSTLDPAQTTLRMGIPVTTPARTLADLRRCATPDELSAARRQAEIRGYRFADDPEPDLTHSELERRFLRLCRRHRLPTPEVNVGVGGFVVDVLWREHGLIVETDGYRYHRGRAAFEHDHRRQARLAAAGYEVLRFTWRQVVEDPVEVMDTVRIRLLRLPYPAPKPG